MAVVDPDLAVTAYIADVGHSVRWTLLPEPVRARAKHSLLDTLGVLLPGSKHEAVRIAREVAITGSAGEARVVGGLTAAPVDAAFVNGVAAHVLDFDDGLRRREGYGDVGHISSVLVSAATAVAADRDLTGAALCAAMVAGYEVSSRVASLVGRAHYDAGFHSTATFGCFAAAAATAHLLELDEHGWRMALGIAGTEAAGLRASFGTMCKSLHVGRAASSGVLAGLLAGAGFTGAPDILEARNGFAWAQSPLANPADAMRPLGQPYATEDLHYKFHAAGYGLHAPIEGVKRLRAQHGFAPGDVERIAVQLPYNSALSTYGDRPDPRTGIEAKFSVYFAVAAALLGFDTTEAGFTDERAVDPVVRDVMRRVTVTEEPDHPDVRTTDVDIWLANAAHHRMTLDVMAPWTDLDAEWEALVEKFRRLADGALGSGRATRIVELVANLDDLPVRTLLADAIP